MRLSYKQIIQNTEGLFTEEEFNANLTGFKKIFNELHTDTNVEELLECITHPDCSDYIEIAQRIKSDFKKVVLIGIGGSSLGAKTFSALRSDSLLFMENLDVNSINKVLKQVNIEETLFLVISKSGNTIETLAQFSLCLDLFSNSRKSEYIKSNFLVITENKENPMYHIAIKFGITIVDWHKNISGRFSAITRSCLIPACISGCNIELILEKAKHSGEFNLNQETSYAFKGAVLNYMLLCQGFDAIVLMPYFDQLYTFTLWFKQLWAESLSKGDLYYIPIESIGTVDQHSQLQMYLSKERKFFMNLIVSSNAPKSDLKVPNFNELELISGKDLANISHISQLALRKSLTENNIPTRIFEMDNIDEGSIASLMVHFMLEVVFLARILEVNPFDQPEVEKFKQKLIAELKC